MSFSPNGQTLAVADHDGTARIWKVDTGTPITPPLQNYSAALCAVFSRDGSYLLTGSKDGIVRVWDATTGDPITPLLWQNATVENARFSPDGRTVRTVGHGEGSENEQGTIATWELVSEQRPTSQLLLLAQILSAHRLDASGTLMPLDASSISNAWWALHTRQ